MACRSDESGTSGTTHRWNVRRSLVPCIYPPQRSHVYGRECVGHCFHQPLSVSTVCPHMYPQSRKLPLRSAEGSSRSNSLATHPWCGSYDVRQTAQGWCMEEVHSRAVSLCTMTVEAGVSQFRRARLTWTVILPDRSCDTSNPSISGRTKELVAVTEQGHVTSIVTSPTARASAAIVMHGQ